VATAGVALVLLIGFSRLYFGVHYLTDILAGFLAAPLCKMVRKCKTT
jgi:undecaprenyl-diphosphatase